ncbi:methionine ABC transporter ATP-binding protein [Paenibacillus sp. OAS669]|uniref:methionine ABC transporter ATP-binding protein n=1 Tax=Paenibacillus sp. OAS669 TaxID=2663821 RepID=UPI001789E319|nr:ATP-binding cassette domain-containing protein [Paenibacillus sp. OAS669]MBE1442864.1 D-methionine transport system ATP-binding protein [Paenibacillus sp. OAS669]
MIEMINVSKTFEQKGTSIEAVREVDLCIKKGEIFGIIGYSGAGKSTLLRCINFLEKPTSGSIRINGVEMSQVNEIGLRMMRRKMGMIFQHFNLLSSGTVYENIAAPLELAKVPKKQIMDKVRQLLELVGLQDKDKAYPRQLSGGQKQRVAIARALANNPEVLLCDEATSALDPQTTDSILDLLMDINRKFNITIVLITHEMHVIKKACDRVAVMENGRIIEQGTVIDLFQAPKTATAAKFIKSVLDTDLPAKLQSLLQKQPGIIIRALFRGESIMEPLLANVTVKFDVRPSVLFGHITELKDNIFGALVVHIAGESDAIEHGMRYLKEHGLRIEVIQDVR